MHALPLSLSVMSSDPYILRLWLMFHVLLMVKRRKHCYNTMICFGLIEY
jgi:hypothetical protein